MFQIKEVGRKQKGKFILPSWKNALKDLALKDWDDVCLH
jgi:hypothetical protein